MDELDQDIFINLYESYVEKFGKDSIKGIFHLHRQLSKNTKVKNFPAAELWRFAFFEEFHREFIKTNDIEKTVEKLAQKDDLSRKIIMDFFQHHYDRIKTTVEEYQKKKSTPNK